MNNMRFLPKLLVFAAVAKHGSFTEASKELKITKSAVSQHISQLEAELSVSLLNRTTRGVSLTALGEKLLLRCQSLQDQADLIFTDISNATTNPKGSFKITYPHSLETNVVMPAIEQFCIEFSGIEPELMVTDSCLDIIEHDLDVAIHIGELPDSSYRALPIGTIKEIFCATPVYLSKTSILETYEQLSEHRWISTSWQQQNMSIIDLNNEKKSDITLNQFAQVNSLPSALEMALHHMGFVLLPDIVALPLIKKGELIHLIENITGPHWPVYTFHAYQKEKPVYVTRFHQLVSSYFTGLV